jgi:hypothetical protein
MTIMIKCGTLAAVVIASSAAGTATLISDLPSAERVATSGSSASAQTMTTRGTRSSLTLVDAFTSPIGDQPRRGARQDYQSDSVTMLASPADDLRRGTR